MRKEYHDLVICNNCQWSASLLIDSYTFDKCPNCMTDNIEVIQVSDYESYILNIHKDKGIDVEFSMTKLGPDK
jgi:peptide subunit release factor 1 (eRF1)